MVALSLTRYRLNKSSVSVSIMRSTILPYTTIRISSRTTTLPDVISSGKLFARSFFFLLRKPFLDCWGLALCYVYLILLCTTTLSFSSVLYAASIYLTRHPVFAKSCNNSVITNMNTTTGRISKRRPSSSQVSLRIPSSTMTRMNGLCQQYTISHISTMDLPSAAFSSFPSRFSQSPLALRHLLDATRVPTLSKSPYTEKTRRTLSTKRKPRKI